MYALRDMFGRQKYCCFFFTIEFCISSSSLPHFPQIICFRSPIDPDRVLVKRVVACGGEYVRVNLGGLTGMFQVPEGRVWVEGDNTDHSIDSRRFGAIPLGLILGRAKYIVWPPQHLGKLERDMTYVDKIRVSPDYIAQVTAATKNITTPPSPSISHTIHVSPKDSSFAIIPDDGSILNTSLPEFQVPETADIHEIHLEAIEETIDTLDALMDFPPHIPNSPESDRPKNEQRGESEQIQQIPLTRITTDPLFDFMKNPSLYMLELESHKKRHALRQQREAEVKALLEEAEKLIQKKSATSH